MGFSTRCTKKGCGKETEPLLNKTDNKIYCGCAESHEITTLTEFAKRQLVSFGQTTNKKKSVNSFSVKCPSCQRQGTPKLDKVSGNLTCNFCDAPLTNLSAPFVKMLRDQLGRGG